MKRRANAATGVFCSFALGAVYASSVFRVSLAREVTLTFTIRKMNGITE